LFTKRVFFGTVATTLHISNKRDEETMVGHVVVACIAVAMVVSIVLMLLVGRAADRARHEEREQIRRDWQ
jgi:hypothetical protein